MARSVTHPGGNLSQAAKFLLKHGPSRTDIAEVLDVDPTEITRWLSGAKRCHVGALVATILWLRGHDPDHVQDTDTDDLTPGELADLKHAFTVVNLCEAAYIEKHPGETFQWRTE